MKCAIINIELGIVIRANKSVQQSTDMTHRIPIRDETQSRDADISSRNETIYG